MIKCKHILISGKNKGKECGKNCGWPTDGYCSAHSAMYDKEKKKQELQFLNKLFEHLNTFLLSTYFDSQNSYIEELKEMNITTDNNIFVMPNGDRYQIQLKKI